MHADAMAQVRRDARACGGGRGALSRGGMARSELRVRRLRRVRPVDEPRRLRPAALLPARRALLRSAAEPRLGRGAAHRFLHALEGLSARAAAPPATRALSTPPP